MSIKILIGDLFSSKAQTLVNTVNCTGIMGKGIAQQFKERFPDMFRDYVARCERNEVQLGRPYLYKDLYGVSIVNFPTKKHWRSVSRVEDIIKGLQYFLEKYKEWKITSVAFPPLGCGNGGLEWDIVGPILYQNLSQIDISVEIYAPYGTPSQKLTHDFLSKTVERWTEKTLNASKEKVKQEWFVLLEVLSRLQQQPYSLPVGRTIFQKICYVATEMGLDTGFRYKQGTYGPFSSQIKPAISVLANANLILETQSGRMIHLKVGPQYESTRKHKLDFLEKHQNLIEKITDLFLRIKDTEQAEEVSTVLYTVQELTRRTNQSLISEQEVYDFIIQWKKSWNTEEKRKAVADTIRSLGMLGWIKTEFSESLLVDA
ncbi:MAG: macro domain-containing protein [Anaerohalosphaeraceae bacterium]